MDTYENIGFKQPKEDKERLTQNEERMLLQVVLVPIVQNHIFCLYNTQCRFPIV
jgi:hypothetical protein